MVRASSLQMLFPSQNGSQAGIPIPPEIPPIHLQPLSFPTAHPWSLGVRIRAHAHGPTGPPPTLALPKPSVAPVPPCSAVLQPGAGWLCRDGTSAITHVPQHSGGKLASGLESLSRVCACSPLPPSPCQLRCPHASSITPSQAAPHYFPPSCPTDFIILSCLSQPEREKAIYLQPGLLGTLGPSGLGAACPVWLLWLVFNLQESRCAETGSSAARAYPNRALHWCYWCLGKASTAGQGARRVWGLAGTQWEISKAHFLIPGAPRAHRAHRAHPSPWSWDRLPGTSGLHGFFWESSSFVSGK